MATDRTAATRLNALLDEDLAAHFRRNPLMATVRGVRGYNHLLPDLSPASCERERGRERAALSALRALDRSALEGEERLSFDLALDKLELAVEGQRFREADALVLSTLGGIQNVMARAAQVTPFHAAEDYEEYIERLRAMPRTVEDAIERLRAGLVSGWLSPWPVIDRVVAAIDAHVVADVEASVLLGPFRNVTHAVPESRRAALAEEARRAVAETYQPAMRRFRAFVLEEYRPRAPREAGLAAMPGGVDYYEFLIKARIVRGMKASDIHALGLSEVARLREEIGAIAAKTGFDGGTDAFITYLRTDPRHFFSSPEEVLATYRAMPERVDPQLPRLFHAIPRMRYQVRAMTPAEAASSTAANYMIGSLALGTGGWFTINALGFAAEARWRRETLFLHEAVPGHHMQNARAAEIEGLHPWRAMGGATNIAYGEGWALYAERLGWQMGMYTDPLQHYGHLQAQLFRAARLVVDTGIHAFGWARERAIAYMTGEGGVDDVVAVSEVDRYFSNPAQALGYLLGLHKFVELREKAERSLGGRFDQRDFHAVAIDHGPMPLAVLERRVEEWIAGVASA